MNGITLRNVSKSFGEKTVLSGFSRTFAVGSRSCVMGPSGRGKTTLINIVLGLLPPDSGTVSGVPQNVSAVFQEDRLIESRSALYNVRLVAGRSYSEEKTRSLLASLGLSGSESVPVSELSGGMKRRVAIARALSVPFDLLVLDEPFKGIDAATRAEVVSVIDSYLENKTLIMVSHDREEASLLAAEVIEL